MIGARVLDYCMSGDDCADAWEREQAACGEKYGVCMLIAGTSPYLKKQCGREYAACLAGARENYLRCVGR